MKKKWMPEEERLIITMVEAGATNAAIAESLNRSIAAVAHKRARLYAAADDYSDISADYQFDEAEDDANDVQNGSFYDELATMTGVVKKINTALDDCLAAHSEELENLRNLCEDNTRIINGLLDYLNHSWLWRMFHRVGTCRSQEGYMDKPIEEG